MTDRNEPRSGMWVNTCEGYTTDTAWVVFDYGCKLEVSAGSAAVKEVSCPHGNFIRGIDRTVSQ